MSESMPTSQFPMTRIETTNQANLIKNANKWSVPQTLSIMSIDYWLICSNFLLLQNKNVMYIVFFYPMTCFQNELEISLVKYKAQRQRSLKYGSQFWLKLTFLTPSYHEFNLPTRFTVDEKIIMFTLEMAIKAPH